VAAIRVGFVGLGDMGRPMAERLLEQGFELSVYGRRPATVEPFQGRAAIAPSMAELAASCDVLGVCVFGDADVAEVLAGPAGAFAGARPGLVVLVHSTVHPSTCVDLAQQGARRSVELLDAPVSGGAGSPARGELVTMVGGESSTLESARPVLEAFSRQVLHLGPVGSGQIAKLLNNLVLAGNLGIVCDALDLAAKLGVDADAVLEVLQSASGSSRAVTTYRSLAPMERLLQVCKPLEKDVAIVGDLASSAGGLPDALDIAARRFVDLL
jgi:3-hydroxyisobutyrate dehydrogenase-like beta-hydroxyacid dehydrogenase